MKKFLFVLFASMLILLIAGCGVKEKLEQKAGEAFAEKIIKGAGGDVDIDGDKVVIKGKDGETLTFGETQWPTSDLTKSIPEYRGGKVASVMEANDSLLIILEEVPEKDFLNYLDEIKKTFTGETYEMKSEDGVTFGAVNGEEIGVVLVYTTGESLSITVIQQGK